MNDSFAHNPDGLLVVYGLDSMRLFGLLYGVVTKTVHKTLPGQLLSV